MRSFTRLAMKSDSTSLRRGGGSGGEVAASIEVERSSAITMSMPSTDDSRTRRRALRPGDGDDGQPPRDDAACSGSTGSQLRAPDRGPCGRGRAAAEKRSTARRRRSRQAWSSTGASRSPARAPGGYETRGPGASGGGWAAQQRAGRRSSRPARSRRRARAWALDSEGAAALAYFTMSDSETKRISSSSGSPGVRSLRSEAISSELVHSRASKP